ncbi:phosphatase PAP2 family protein [bacterium]|nr:phosphatase PAP2 family protein [bacterium]
MQIFSHFVANLEGFVSQGGYWALFVMSVIESLPLVGSIVPGHTMIVLAGFLARLGVFNVWYVTILASLGAIIGDAVSYFMGKKYGFGFLKKAGSYLSVHEDNIHKAKAAIDAHTGKALVFGRFNPVTRAVTPFLVGASEAHWARFWFYNILGAVLWAASSVLVGYVFGASYHVVAGYIGKFAGVAVVLGILIVWAYRFINTRWHIFVKYDLFTLGFNLISLYTLFKTIQDSVGEKTFLIEIDVAINTAINTFIIFHDVALRGVHVAEWVSVLGSGSFIGIVSVIAVVWFGYRRRWAESALVMLSVGGGALWVVFMKTIFARMRPENMLVDMGNSYSFPSFHATAAAIATVLIIYLWAVHIRSLARREWAIVGVFLVGVFVAFTRIYISVHWFSDVLAGYALGIFWTTLSILFVKYVGALIKKNPADN